MKLPELMRKTWTVAVLVAGTLAYLALIAGIVMFGMAWAGCNWLSAAFRSRSTGSAD